MARRNQHNPEEIKAMVLSAAEAIVTEQGGSALTVRKIAIRIGYTVGSVYKVFDNMADVISHINGQTLEAITCHLSQTPAQGLQGLGRAYLCYATQNFHRWRLWSETQIATNSRTSKTYQAKVDALINLIGSHLQNTGNPAQKTRLATTLWAAMQGVCAALLTGQAESIKDAEDSMDLLMALLAKN